MEYKLIFKDDEMLYYNLQSFYKHLEDEFELNNSSDELRVIFNETQTFSNTAIINDDYVEEKIKCKVYVFGEEGITFEHENNEDKFIPYNKIDSLHLVLKNEEDKDFYVTMWEE